MSQNNNEVFLRNPQKKIKMNISTTIRDVLSNWWRILLISLAVALFAFVKQGLDYSTTYTVSAKYIVSQGDTAFLGQNLSAASETASQLTQIIDSSVMKKTVMDDLGIDYFDGVIRARAITETNLMELSVTSSTPKMAFDILNSIMDNYDEIAKYIVGDYVMEVLQEATIPLQPDVVFYPYPMMVKLFVICFAALCVVIGIISYLRDTIRSGDDVEKKLDGKLIGVINFEKKYKSLANKIKKQRNNMLITNPVSSFMYTENFKKTQNRIKNRMDRHGEKVLMVTSVAENEGKSLVASNLALAFAEESDKVLLIDGDFRKPALYKIFDKESETTYNLGEIISGRANKELYEKTVHNDLFVAFNTVANHNSSEAILNSKLGELLETLRQTMDYIIIDCAPMGLVADTEEIANFADASVLVVRQHKVEAKYINDNIALLGDCKARFLGVVLNGVYGVASGMAGRMSEYTNYERNYSK